MAWNFWDTAGGEPLYATRLDRGAAFTSTSTTDLKGVDTTSAPNTLKTFHLSYGTMALDVSLSGVDRAEYQIAPTTGIGLWVLQGAHANAVESYNSENINYLMGKISDLEATIATMQSQISQLPTIQIVSVYIHPGAGSVGANSEVDVTVPFPGAMPTDIPVIWAPAELEAELSVSRYTIPAANIFQIRIRHSNGGAVSTASRRWLIGALRGAVIGYA
jgi:hypothetical protein